jgi:hypothetical protein
MGDRYLTPGAEVREGRDMVSEEVGVRGSFKIGILLEFGQGACSGCKVGILGSWVTAWTV